MPPSGLGDGSVMCREPGVHKWCKSWAAPVGFGSEKRNLRKGAVRNGQKWAKNEGCREEPAPLGGDFGECWVLSPWRGSICLPQPQRGVSWPALLLLAPGKNFYFFPPLGVVPVLGGCTAWEVSPRFSKALRRAIK